MGLDAVTVKQVFAAIENHYPALAVELVTRLSDIESRKLLWQSRQPHSSGQGDTPMHLAARAGQVTVLKAAYEDGAALNVLNYHRKQPLHEAAQTGQAGCVAFLLETAKVPVDPLKRADWTPLMLACVGPGRPMIEDSHANQPNSNSSYIQCVKLLLENGADPTFTNKDGWNCLQLACRANCKEMVTMIVQRHPNLIHSRTGNGRTCLHCLAATAADPDCVHTPRLENGDCCCVAHKLLHVAPSLLFTSDSCGTLPVFDALRRGHVQLATCFLNHASSTEQLTAHDKLGQQPVHVAAEAGQLFSLKLIVQYLGPKILAAQTQQTPDSKVTGISPLHLACRSGQLEVVDYITQMMIQSSSSSSIISLPIDTNGHSPIWYAMIGTAGCGSSAIERREQCAHLVWIAFSRVMGMGHLQFQTSVTHELRCLLHTSLPDPMRKLGTHLLRMCENKSHCPF